MMAAPARGRKTLRPDVRDVAAAAGAGYADAAEILLLFGVVLAWAGWEYVKVARLVDRRKKVDLTSEDVNSEDGRSEDACSEREDVSGSAEARHAEGQERLDDRRSEPRS